MTLPESWTRREFLTTSASCAAHLSAMAAPFPLTARSLWSRRTQGKVVAQEPFGRLEEVGEGLWAFISTPLSGDYLTVCNGGIIQGTEGILVVEAFQTSEGARWIGEQTRNLTGSWPTHVLITHFHGDHSNGLQGFATARSGGGQSYSSGASQPLLSGGDRPSRSGGGQPAPSGPDSEGPGGPGPASSVSQAAPLVHVTATTRTLKEETFGEETEPALRRLWADVVLTPEDSPTILNLGSRQVNVEPLLGHTPSDLTVELPEDGLVWCGDLVWNGMFPNYMDAIPSRLSRSVRALSAPPQELFVPGHGPLANTLDLHRYLAVIDGVEETARRARSEGWTAQEAAQRHRIPPNLGNWTLFNPSYFQRAIEAWMREWS